jgi:hypothetical protein
MKYFITLVLICFGISAISAQEVYNSSGRPGKKTHRQEASKKGFDPSKLIFGGGVALAFGDITDLGASPMVGYNFSDKFAAGVGLGYEYLNVKNYWALYDQNSSTYLYYPLKTSVVYPSVWARYLFSRNVFVHAQFEYDVLHATQYDYDANYNVVSSQLNVGVPCLLVGPGIRYPMAGRVGFTFMALYDVLQQPYSPYKSSDFLTGIVFRVGIFAGF